MFNYEKIGFTQIEFEPVLNGKKRQAIPKQKVSGYKYSSVRDFHFYKRGDVIFCFEESTGVFDKLDCKNKKNLSVTYADFHRFFDIKVTD